MSEWLKSIAVHGVAGYRSIFWERLDRRCNIILGLNGAGKSTLLQSVAMALRYARGESTDKLFSRGNLEASIELVVSDGSAEHQHVFKFKEINRRKRSSPVFPAEIIQVVENRQPQNTIGRGTGRLWDHAMKRYPKTLSVLHSLGKGETKNLEQLQRVREMCHSIMPTGSWSHIFRSLEVSGHRQPRQASCGEFDIASIALDLVRADPALPAFVVLDNPDLFLHPAAQEALLSEIRNTLPGAQIMCATHSLKLLALPQQKGVFWLSRDRVETDGTVKITPTRQLRDGAASAFFELYGPDVSTATLNLLYSFTSPEYYKFLLECALPPDVISRPDVESDRQIGLIMEEIRRLPNAGTIVEIGPGHGDVVEALRVIGATGERLRYIAKIPDTDEPGEILSTRLAAAITDGVVSPNSKVVCEETEVPEDADLVYAMNVFHELDIETMASVLARLLSHTLRKVAGARLVLIEATLLSKGEADFIMWISEDYEALLDGVDELIVRSHRLESPGRVPIEATLVVRKTSNPIDLDASDLAGRIRRYLPQKEKQLLRRIWSLRRQVSEKPSPEEFLRQRKHAFCVAQVGNIRLAQHSWQGRMDEKKRPR